MALTSSNSLNSHLHEVVFSDRHYINKLGQLKDLINYLDKSPRLPNQNFFMLIRPRGFGLSMANEAIESLLSRDEMLIDHLQNKLENQVDLTDLNSYAVLHLSFTNPKANNLSSFIQELQATLQKQIWEHHVKLKVQMSLGTDLRQQMVNLIKGIADLNKQQVVILVDNYDLPIYTVRRLEDETERQQALALYFDMLNAFRQAGEYVKFCLLAGHIKFGLSNNMSEGLPHVVDLSFSDIAATVIGFTVDEVKKSYAEDLARVAPQQGITQAEYLKAFEACYGGFCFSDKMQKVLCPMSVTRALDNDGDLYAFSCDHNYKFVSEVIEETEPDLAWLIDKDGQDQLFLEEIDLFPKDKQLGSMLLQLGFVSVNKVTFAEGEHSLSWRYRFGLTNVEMRRAFMILMKQARPELRELPINPRVFHAGEDEYLITE